MKGIEFAEIRDVIVRAFDGDEFDMFLYERLDFDRPTVVADGPFKKVVNDVLKEAQKQGWEARLIAEVAAARPIKAEVQQVYKKYARALVGEMKQSQIDKEVLAAYQRFGLVPTVDVQNAGVLQGPASQPATDGGLEKTINRYLPFLDVGLWREKLFGLEGRVCRVELNDAKGTMGTGFLVGPGALLTNYHVLETVLNGTLPPGGVRFRFDYKNLANGSVAEGTVASLHPTDWRVDDSPYSPAEKQGNPDGTPPTADELDYALVRLDTDLGAAASNPAAADGPKRGWVKVPAAAPVIDPTAPVLILQHPEKAPLKLAFDTNARPSVIANGLRVRYATNTEGGSSGSPCFDVNWNLIALHHYGDPAFNHPKYNQGIPIAKIRERLTKGNKADALGGDPP